MLFKKEVNVAMSHSYLNFLVPPSGCKGNAKLQSREPDTLRDPVTVLPSRLTSQHFFKPTLCCTECPFPCSLSGKQTHPSVCWISLMSPREHSLNVPSRKTKALPFQVPTALRTDLNCNTSCSTVITIYMSSCLMLPNSTVEETSQDQRLCFIHVCISSV